MNVPRISTWHWICLGTLAGLGIMAACSLNPQPLPPDANERDAGAGGTSSQAQDGAALSLAADSGNDDTGSVGAGDGGSPRAGDASTGNPAPTETDASALAEGSSDAEQADVMSEGSNSAQDASGEASGDAGDATNEEAD